MKTYNRYNFYKHTFCIFDEVDLTEIKDVKPNYRSNSGSAYYFLNDGVFRYSNHWGRAANCKWRLNKNENSSNNNQNRTKLGFAKWTDFYPENDYEKLYFVEVNYEYLTANFFHKQSEKYTEKVILRTSVETTKLLKQIRVLLEETAWAKYLNVSSIEELRKEIIPKIIETNQTFQEIRRYYL